MLKIFRDAKTVNDDFLKEYIFRRVGEKLHNSSNLPVSSTYKDKLGKLNLKTIKELIFYVYITTIKDYFHGLLKTV